MYDSTNAEARAMLGTMNQDQEMLRTATAIGLSRGYSADFYRKQRESVEKQRKKGKGES